MKPATWSAGTVTPAVMNTCIRDAYSEVSGAVYGILHTSGDIAGAPATVTEMYFKKSQTRNMSVVTKNGYPSALKVTKAGMYVVEYTACAQIDATNGALQSHLVSYVKVNGDWAHRGIYTARTAYQQVSVTKGLLSLKVGDTVTAHTYTDAGRSANYVVNGDCAASNRLSLSRFGDYPWVDLP
ncbi:hypothetical protein H9W91_07335 [Streptomyces alfalfae]|uniref:hypothetical protein n=1 Tax=Streptomyces alfalfae TaxID=1642299 RepID=UPI001BAE4F8D|nr:hypothetical protein [Streptomyces alfalfae]QUI30692.1 hypothetical protein H9W91_07335 [Streptomyces alfalfae]